jgi:hypothetical protein
MTRRKSTDQAGYLFGLPVLQPEWQSRRNDARQHELEKTQALRAARLAAQARTAKAPAKQAPGSGVDAVGQRRARPAAAE